MKTNYWQFLLALTPMFLVGSVQAGGTFNFIQKSDASPELAILAVLELSGASPFDHTAVESLTFTPLADEVLGLTGLYEGELDVTLGENLVVENSNHELGATSTDSTSIGAMFLDNDPPVVVENPPLIGVSTPTRLSLSFFNVDEPVSYINNGLENRSALGTWVRAIPEPGTVSIAALLAVFFLAQMGRIETKLNL